MKPGERVALPGRVKPFGAKGKAWLLMVALLLILLQGTQPVLAQEDGEGADGADEAGAGGVANPDAGLVPDTEASARSSEVEEGPENAEETKAEAIAGKEEFLKGGKPVFSIDNISPAHGPTTGDTRVTVRGGPFARFALDLSGGLFVIGSRFTGIPKIREEVLFQSLDFVEFESPRFMAGRRSRVPRFHSYGTRSERDVVRC